MVNGAEADSRNSAKVAISRGTGHRTDRDEEGIVIVNALGDSDGGAAAKQSVGLPRDLQLLVESLRGPGPPTGVDWDALRSLAEVHGVVPLLYSRWRLGTGTVPSDLIEEARGAGRAYVLRGTLALRQRDEIVHLLSEAEIPHLVLKGAALAQRWYGNLSLRPFADIDILLPRGEIAHAEAVLRRVQYESFPFPSASHHAMPVRRPGSPCAVELHHTLTHLPLHRDLSFEDMHERAISPVAENVQLRTLSPEDTLLHLCLHLLQHMKLSYGWQLRYLYDIERHIATFPINWEVFAARTRGAQVARACSAALALAASVVGADVPLTIVDEKAGFDLFQYPLLAPPEHRSLASFIQALRNGDFVGMLSAVGRTMIAWDQVEWHGGGGVSARHVRPHLLVVALAKLVRGGMSQPEELITRTRAWITGSRDLRGGERVVTDLFEG